MSRQGPEALAEQLSLSVDRVHVALRYAAEFPDEIEDRITLHELETAHYDRVSG